MLAQEVANPLWWKGGAQPREEPSKFNADLDPLEVLKHIFVNILKSKISPMLLYGLLYCTILIVSHSQATLYQYVKVCQRS